MDQIMIENHESYKSDLTKTEQDDVDIWELHVKEREEIMTQIAKAARVSRIRNWIELICMLGFIYYMLYDMYLSLIHISEPTRQLASSRMPSSA